MNIPHSIYLRMIKKYKSRKKGDFTNEKIGIFQVTSLGKVTKPGWCRGWFFAFGVPMGSLFWRGPWIRFGWVTRAWQIDDEKTWPSKIYHTFWIRFFPPHDVFKFLPSDLKKMAWPSRHATNETSKALRHLLLLKNWTFKSIYIYRYTYINIYI